MSKGKRGAPSLKWAFGAITIVFILFATSLTHSAEIDDVRAEIQAAGATWEAAENSISMLPPEERVRLLGVLPGEEPFEGEEIYSGKEGMVSIPTSVNWRNNGGNYVSSVKDQGSCGSCWAFAVTGALESKAMISLGTPGKNLNLSEQIVLSCSGAEGSYGPCGGGYIDRASAFLYSTGDGKEGCYPYTGTNGNCSNACTSWTYRPYRLTSSWAWVATNENAMKTAIADFGPIVVTLAVYRDFYYYGGGVYHHTWGKYEGLHAILAVGYNDTGRYFIVKNSWGPYWGEGGYFRISYDEVSAQRFGWGWCNGNPPYPCGAGTIYYPSGVLPVAVTLTSPNGAEHLESGGTFNITWNPPNNPGDYDLWYSLNNGLTWKLIQQDVPGTNYMWNVPVLPKNTSKCLIGIEDFYNNKEMSEDISSAPFTIDVVGITSPNGGEFVPSGGTWPIIWTTNGTTGAVDSVKLTYTVDNGLTWKPITTLPGDPGSHVWDVPTVKADKAKCKVKVVLRDGAGKTVGSDMSDSTFTITPNPF